MRIAEIDNSASLDLSRAITWQYDNANNLVAFIGLLNEFYYNASEKFWNNWTKDVVNVSLASDFGLSIWGLLLNCPRPTLEIDGESVLMSTELYRKILIGRFRLLGSRATFSDYCEYLNSIFDGQVKIVDNADMSIDFDYDGDLDDERVATIEQFGEHVFLYPAGIRDSSHSSGPVIGFGPDSTHGDIGQAANRREYVDVEIRGTAGQMIPANCEISHGGTTFKSALSATIPSEGVVIVRFCSTNNLPHHIPAYSIHSISGASVRYVCNPHESFFDLSIDTLDNSTVSWRK